MRHIELIETLYKNRELIDRAFNGEIVEEIPSELVGDIAIFQKVAKEYELSDSYIQFANTILKRVDANYTFGDYNEEIKMLMKQKSDYLEFEDKTTLVRIKKLTGTLYKKIEQRDRLINARINDIVNDNELSIERIIKDAKDVDDRISELIEGHSENLKILGQELRGLDENLDDILVDIGLDILPLTKNIHIYNKRLSDFILRSEKRKEQNKKLAAISNKIIKESDEHLKALLLSKHSIYHHTLKEKKSSLVKILPNAQELKRTTFQDSLKRALSIEKTHRKATNKEPYQSSESVELKSIGLELIMQDIIQDKPQNIYDYILKHSEIQKFKEEGLERSFAFKTYLTIVQENRQNITLTNDYNNNIKVAQWT